MAEEEDDDSFGDFTFASFSNHALGSDQINSRKSTSGVANNDDEWGDFVETPLRSVVSATQPASNASEQSKPFDPFGFFPDHSAKPAQLSESVAIHDKSERTEWVKPKGALPLSIFGDAEQEEEESDVVDPMVVDTGNKHASNVSNGSKVLMGLAFNDIIANLYSQNHGINAENESNSNSNGSNCNVIATNSNANGLISNSSGLNSNSDLFTGNNGAQIQQVDNVNSFSSQSDMFPGNDDSHKHQNKDVNLDSDVFAGSFTFSRNGDSESAQIKVATGLSSNFDLFSGSINQSPQIKAVSGVNSKHDLFSGNNVNQSPPYKAVSGLSSSSDLFSGDDDSQSPEAKAMSGWSSNSNLFSVNSGSQNPLAKAVCELRLNLDLLAETSDSQGQQISAARGLDSYPTELSSNSNLFSGNVDSDAFAYGYDQSQQNEVQNANKLNSNVNAATSNINANFDAWISNSVPPLGNEEFDGGDDGWEFKDAFSDWEVGHRNDKDLENSNKLNSNFNASTSNLNGMDSNFDVLISRSGPPLANEELEGDDDGWEFKDAFSDSKVGDRNDKVPGISFEFGKESNGSVDLFSASNGFPDMGSDFKLPTVNLNIFSSDSFFKSELIGTENELNSNPVVGDADADADADEGFGDFLDASTGADLKQVLQDEPKHADLPHSEVNAFSSNDQVQEKETKFGNNKGALPLSIFGDEELETDDSLNAQDDFAQKLSSHPRSGVYGQGSNVSIHDLISNLYSQAAQTYSVNNTGKLPGNGLEFSDEVLNTGSENGDNDFDDASWEFKDAAPLARAIEPISVHIPGDALEISPTKSNPTNYVDFYSKLKDELLFVCRCHLNGLKKAQNNAALSGEGATAAAIEEEIQGAYKELQNLYINSDEYSADQLPRDVSISQFLEFLHEPEFQALESEYHLSSILQLVEKDLKSAIELLRHTTLLLNILALGSMEDQHAYVSTWSKMISVCAQELKDASCIWNQLAEKNLTRLVLSDRRGKCFILALGEIYRVVEVLGASIKLYKPWLLSSSIDSTSIYALLEECYSLWSSSGIEEALKDISDPVDFEYHSTVKSLWESIKSIRELDMFALGNCVFDQQLPICQLSLLTSETVPDMKRVFWNGEYYFLTLANLWANLISRDPPELPHLNVGS
ncbi:hypothetical protein NMG60_11020730 [Bertholletia excelsa]